MPVFIGAFIGADGFAMNAVRVGAAVYLLGPLACPRCGRRDPTHLDGYGIFRPTCRGKQCRCSWTAVRLPPGVTAAQLADTIGGPAAVALLTELGTLKPGYTLADLRTAVVPGGAQEALYVQRAPDTPEPLMGWHQATTILNSLMRPA
jgi:hypothetical protein